MQNRLPGVLGGSRAVTSRSQGPQVSLVWASLTTLACVPLTEGTWDVNDPSTPQGVGGPSVTGEVAEGQANFPGSQNPGARSPAQAPFPGGSGGTPGKALRAKRGRLVEEVDRVLL